MMRVMLFLTLSFTLAACSSPKNTYYTLSATTLPDVRAMTHKTRVMVGPVTLPPSVDKPQLVVKNSTNQVSIYEYQRWGGSLKADIERVVAANLMHDLSTPNVWSYSQTTYSKFDYQVFMDVQSLDSKLGDAVVVDVLWTVKPSALKAKASEPDKVAAATSSKMSVAHDDVITGRSLVREPVSTDGFEPLVAAQSRAFEKVSIEIAKAIHPTASPK